MRGFSKAEMIAALKRFFNKQDVIMVLPMEWFDRPWWFYTGAAIAIGLVIADVFVIYEMF